MERYRNAPFPPLRGKVGIAVRDGRMRGVAASPILSFSPLAVPLIRRTQPSLRWLRKLASEAPPSPARGEGNEKFRLKEFNKACCS